MSDHDHEIPGSRSNAAARTNPTPMPEVPGAQRAPARNAAARGAPREEPLAPRAHDDAVLAELRARLARPSYGYLRPFAQPIFDRLADGGARDVERAALLARLVALFSVSHVPLARAGDLTAAKLASNQHHAVLGERAAIAIEQAAAVAGETVAEQRTAIVREAPRIEGAIDAELEDGVHLTIGVETAASAATRDAVGVDLTIAPNVLRRWFQLVRRLRRERSAAIPVDPAPGPQLVIDEDVWAPELDDEGSSSGGAAPKPVGAGTALRRWAGAGQQMISASSGRPEAARQVNALLEESPRRRAQRLLRKLERSTRNKDRFHKILNELVGNNEGLEDAFKEVSGGESLKKHIKDLFGPKSNRTGYLLDVLEFGEPSAFSQVAFALGYIVGTWSNVELALEILETAPAGERELILEKFGKDFATGGRVGAALGLGGARKRRAEAAVATGLDPEGSHAAIGQLVAVIHHRGAHRHRPKLAVLVKDVRRWAARQPAHIRWRAVQEGSALRDALTALRFTRASSCEYLLALIWRDPTGERPSDRRLADDAEAAQALATRRVWRDEGDGAEPERDDKEEKDKEKGGYEGVRRDDEEREERPHEDDDEVELDGEEELPPLIDSDGDEEEPARAEGEEKDKEKGGYEGVRRDDERKHEDEHEHKHVHRHEHEHEQAHEHGPELPLVEMRAELEGHIGPAAELRALLDERIARRRNLAAKAWKVLRDDWVDFRARLGQLSRAQLTVFLSTFLDRNEVALLRAGSPPTRNTALLRLGEQLAAAGAGRATRRQICEQFGIDVEEGRLDPESAYFRFHALVFSRKHHVASTFLAVLADATPHDLENIRNDRVLVERVKQRMQKSTVLVESMRGVLGQSARDWAKIALLVGLPPRDDDPRSDDEREIERWTILIESALRANSPTRLFVIVNRLHESRASQPHGNIQAFTAKVLAAVERTDAFRLIATDLLEGTTRDRYEPAWEALRDGAAVSSETQLRRATYSLASLRALRWIHGSKMKKGSLITLFEGMSDEELLDQWSNRADAAAHDGSSTFVLDIHPDKHARLARRLSPEDRAEVIGVLRGRLLRAAAASSDRVLASKVHLARMRLLAVLDRERLYDAGRHWTLLTSHADTRRQARALVIGRGRRVVEDGRSGASEHDLDEDLESLAVALEGLEDRTAAYERFRKRANAVTKLAVAVVFTTIGAAITGALTHGAAAAVWIPVLVGIVLATSQAFISAAVERALRGNRYNAWQMVYDIVLKIVQQGGGVGAGFLNGLTMLEGAADFPHLLASALVSAGLDVTLKDGPGVFGKLLTQDPHGLRAFVVENGLGMTGSFTRQLVQELSMQQINHALGLEEEKEKGGEKEAARGGDKGGGDHGGGEGGGAPTPEPGPAAEAKDPWDPKTLEIVGAFRAGNREMELLGNQGIEDGAEKVAERIGGGEKEEEGEGGEVERAEHVLEETRGTGLVLVSMMRAGIEERLRKLDEREMSRKKREKLRKELDQLADAIKGAIELANDKGGRAHHSKEEH